MMCPLTTLSFTKILLRNIQTVWDHANNHYLHIVTLGWRNSLQQLNVWPVHKTHAPEPGFCLSIEISNWIKGNVKAPSTLIRFQTKTELLCSVSNKICIHTYRFRIVFARPHYYDHQEKSHIGTSVRHFGYSRSSGLAPGRVCLDDGTVFR